MRNEYTTTASELEWLPKSHIQLEHSVLLKDETFSEDTF